MPLHFLCPRHHRGLEATITSMVHAAGVIAVSRRFHSLARVLGELDAMASPTTTLRDTQEAASHADTRTSAAYPARFALSGAGVASAPEVPTVAEAWR
jgi:hypothetical protein